MNPPPRLKALPPRTQQPALIVVDDAVIVVSTRHCFAELDYGTIVPVWVQMYVWVIRKGPKIKAISKRSKQGDTGGYEA